jgi:KaiC/GvpD/RAD55 family RecA-like ATPase
MVINGFAHNGKTVLTVEIILANEGAPCLYFTPDETRTVVLSKLTSALYGVSAKEIEDNLGVGDEETMAMLSMTASRFEKLAVYDDNVSLHTMDRAIEDCEAAWGEPPKYAIFDYADLLNYDGDVMAKLDELKRWGKKHKLPFIVLHQSSRTSGSGGQKVTITSGAYGGDKQAFIMVGVRRKINLLRAQVEQLEEKLDNTQREDTARKIRERIHEIEEDLIPRHKDTITINLVKNKRPPMKLVDDIDFKLNGETGRIMPIYKYDPDEEPDMPLPETFTTAKTAREMLSQR